jgi:hypothetical protein
MKTLGDLSRWLAAAFVLAAMAGSSAQATGVDAQPRAVVELFTSQGCSSCPPADKVLGDLAKDPSVIALSMPIDYWDYLGWKDTLADARFSARQKAYSRVRGDRDVYTPQAVVNGATQVIGSDPTQIEAAIAATRGNAVMSIPVSLTISGKHVNVAVAAANDAPRLAHGEVWICSVAKAVPISVGRGENRGRDLTYYNVVRSWLKVGDWSGNAASWTLPLENISRDGVDAAVVYVQGGTRDDPGAMFGAAFTSLQ